MNSSILALRAKSGIEEIDYVHVMTVLQDWAAPRNVVSRLVKNKELIRVKKGIYVFGKLFAKRPYSLEILANKIYGPSYLSCEFALSYWGLIPEKVVEVTSMTTGKSKIFSTPVGRFSYFSLEIKKFSLGMTSIQITEKHKALIALPEKALIDLLFSRKDKIHSKEMLKEILFDDLRINQKKFYSLNLELFEQIDKIYKKKFIKGLIHLLKEGAHA